VDQVEIVIGFHNFTLNMKVHCLLLTRAGEN